MKACYDKCIESCQCPDIDTPKAELCRSLCARVCEHQCKNRELMRKSSKYVVRVYKVLNEYPLQLRKMMEYVFDNYEEAYDELLDILWWLMNEHGFVCRKYGDENTRLCEASSYEIVDIDGVPVLHKTYDRYIVVLRALTNANTNVAPA